MKSTVEQLLELMESTPLENAIITAAEAFGAASGNENGTGLEEMRALLSLSSLLKKLRTQYREKGTEMLNENEYENARKLLELSTAFDTLINEDESYKTLLVMSSLLPAGSGEKAAEAVQLFKLVKILPYLRKYGLAEMVIGGGQVGK